MNKRLLERLELLENVKKTDPIHIYFVTTLPNGELGEREHYMSVIDGAAIKNPDLSSGVEIDLPV